MTIMLKDFISTVINEKQHPIPFSTLKEKAKSHLESFENSQNNFETSELLEDLFSVTEKVKNPKIALLIEMIMGNEFQSLRIGCDHYKNTAITAEIFSKTLQAVENLIERPLAQTTLDFLPMKTVAAKVSSGDIGTFVQTHSHDDNFGELFITFLKEQTSQITHGSKHIHRDDLLNERKEQTLSEVKKNASDDDIPSAPSYSSDDWSDDGRPLKLQTDFLLIEEEPLTATPTEECVTPIFTEESQKSVEEQNPEQIFSPRSNSIQHYFSSNNINKVAPGNSSESISDAAAIVTVQQKPKPTIMSYLFGDKASNSKTPNSNNRKVMPM